MRARRRVIALDRELLASEMSVAVALASSQRRHRRYGQLAGQAVSSCDTTIVVGILLRSSDLVGPVSTLAG